MIIVFPSSPFCLEKISFSMKHYEINKGNLLNCYSLKVVVFIFSWNFGVDEVGWEEI
jgi:hypothetical protein